MKWQSPIDYLYRLHMNNYIWIISICTHLEVYSQNSTNGTYLSTWLWLGHICISSYSNLHIVNTLSGVSHLTLMDGWIIVILVQLSVSVLCHSQRIQSECKLQLVTDITLHIAFEEPAFIKEITENASNYC